MDNDNDGLVTNKPEPMKSLDWILFAFLVLSFLVTFPLLFRIYRFFIPLLLVGGLVYFGIKFFQLTNASENKAGDTSSDLAKVWYTILAIVRKQFRVFVISGICIVGVSVALILAFNQYSKSSVTEKLMNRMIQAAEKYKSQLGYYPSSLTELIGNDPLRREWYQDSWGNTIIYTIKKEGGYRLSSSGADGAAGNSDDLILEK